MATLKTTLTMTYTDAFEDSNMSLSYSKDLTVAAPCTEISRMATNDDIGYGAGVIIPETTTAIHYVYLRHTGLQADHSADYEDAGSTQTNTTNEKRSTEDDVPAAMVLCIR